MRACLAPGAFLRRVDSVWTCSRIMVRRSNLLRAAITPLCPPPRRIILSADACRAHLTRLVWHAAARNGIFQHILRAKMTWCLQPPDTHASAALKRHLSVAAQASAAAAPGGRLSRVLLVSAVCSILQAVPRGRSSAPAFDHRGLRGTQERVFRRTLAKLALPLSPPPSAARSPPALAMLMDGAPRRAIPSVDHVFAPLFGVAILGPVPTVATLAPRVPPNTSRRLQTVPGAAVCAAPRRCL